MAAGSGKKRLFVAAVTNNSLEVVDLAGGKMTNLNPKINQAARWYATRS
jgi:hypothetical protein